MKFVEVPMLPIVIPLGIVTFLLLIRVLHSRGGVTVARASVAAALAIYAGGVLANTVFPIFLRVGTGFYDGPRPLGALIPLVATRPRWWKVLTIVAGASLAIELVQMATARLAMGGHLADINDWMTNTLGGMIGYGLFTLLTRSKKVNALAEHFRRPPRQQPSNAAPRVGNPPPSISLSDQA
ncbi:VanZ family protein [uncultured Microbacterium sp.]|uniref:VanZ family protein n=1 Tax=uncultured Microbacterium sp. TaxID=191216 RepID=UPI0028DCFBF7|nr:VanZ family protein [uncultured Microbacterium sp.]